MTEEIKIGKIKVGGKNPLVLIAGPCVIENEGSCLKHAQRLKEIAQRLDIPFIFKASYDKANRTSIHSYRGPGFDEGLRILRRVKDEIKIPLLSDVHCRTEVNQAAEILDVIQIPAFLSRQTDLITAVAKTGRVVNIKKGQFMAPWDMGNVIEKVVSSGNRNIMITERGTSFGYNNLVSDMRSIAIMRNFGYPVIYDAAHSVQLPGGEGKSSGGERHFVAALARAAAAVGCDGLFLEVHHEPERALCDGPNTVALDTLEGLLKQVKAIDTVVRKEEE